MENDPQELCVRGDLTADRGLHCLDACQGVGDGTDTTDPRGNLWDLVHRLTYGKFLNTPDRGDREPISLLDDTLIIHLQGKLGMAFMSRGWRNLNNFCNGIASFLFPVLAFFPLVSQDSDIICYRGSSLFCVS